MSVTKIEMRVPTRASPTLQQLSNPELRSLAKHHKLDSAISARRWELLEGVSSKMYHRNGLDWSCEALEGTAPARSNGILVSHEQKLYMVGGHGSYPQGESLMMTCDSYTGCWEPVRYFGEEPIEGLADGCTGVVHNHALFALGTNSHMSVASDDAGHGGAVDGLAEGAAVLYKFCFRFKRWECVRLPDSSCFSRHSLLSTHEDDLIMYGKGASDDTCPAEVLWTFNITNSTWQMRPTTGEVPKPREAYAMTVANRRVHLLTLDGDEYTTYFTVYVLDLETWQWRCLPPAQTPFYMDSSPESGDDTIATAVVKDHWVIHGGTCVFDDDLEDAQLHVFDLAELSWIKPPLDTTKFELRKGHMATCHEDNMIVLGGLQQGAHAEEGYCIQAQAQSNFHLSARLINVQSGTPIDPLYADVTFSAGGHDFELHKAVMAPASLVFERMLSSGMQEDISAETMSLMVGWIYGTVDSDLDRRQAVELLVASDKYAVLSLREACIQIIKHHVTQIGAYTWRHAAAQVYDVGLLASSIGCHELVEVCHGVLSHSRYGREILDGGKAAFEKHPSWYPENAASRVDPQQQPGDCESSACHAEESRQDAEDFEAASELNPDDIEWIDELQDSSPHHATEAADITLQLCKTPTAQLDGGGVGGSVAPVGDEVTVGEDDARVVGVSDAPVGDDIAVGEDDVRVVGDGDAVVTQAEALASAEQVNMSPASRSTRYKMQPSAMHRVDDTPDDLEAVHGIHRFGTVHAEATDGQALPSRRSRADTSASAERVESNRGQEAKSWFARSKGAPGKFGLGLAIAGAAVTIGYLVSKRSQ